MSQQYYSPSLAQSYFNPGTGKFSQVSVSLNLAPEWDGSMDSIPDGFGVIRIEMGRDSHDTNEVSSSINGYRVVIPRGSARVVSAVHINRLMNECMVTEYSQTQYSKPPEGYRRPRFPITLVVPPKNSPVLIDPNSGSATKAEAKMVKAPPKKKHNLTVEDDDTSTSADKGSG
jgi:hypothetical protein